MSYDEAIGHRSMAMDRVRNPVYRAALEQVVTPDSVVLDLGAGLGTLGMFAAKLGARHVYLVDPADVMPVTKRIVQANDLQDRVTVIQAPMEEVTLPEKVDVITSVMTGNFLLGEDLLPVLFAARDAWLKPGGALVPSAAVMEAAPVSAPAFYEKSIAGWREPHLGLDFSTCFPSAVNRVHWLRDDLQESTPLSEPAELQTMDLTTATDTTCDVSAEVTITEPGTLHGWVGWFRMQLGEAWLSTSPYAEPVHWSAAFLPIDEPVPVEAGQRVSLHVQRPPRGDWTWSVSWEGRTWRHSTFLGNDLSPSMLRLQSEQGTPTATAKGRALATILSKMDGAHTIADLAAELRAAAPDAFPTDADALAEVRTLARRYGQR